MNIYRILTSNYGNTQSYIVQAYDVINAIQCNGIPMQDVIRVELIGSANEINNTEWQGS